jgi:hypothetical protein
MPLNVATPEDIRLIFREEFNRIISEFQKPQVDETILSQHDVMRLYQVTRPPVVSWGKMGKLKPIKMGKRVYYKKSELPK